MIRFASKITNLNFVFEEADLQFSVTVVSEEAVTAKSMMAALSQVLRMHDLTPTRARWQCFDHQKHNSESNTHHRLLRSPRFASGQCGACHEGLRIKNANVNTIAGIIRPMSSQGALIEVSVETRQLIVTDITTNVEQIASLLTSLDAPHTPLDVETVRR